ncbi:MAG: hypothetical protein AB7V13_24580, partial [Pseudorhodoplanes sp.]
YVLSDIEADRDWLHHLTSSISSPKNLTGLRGWVMDPVHSIISGRRWHPRLCVEAFDRPRPLPGEEGPSKLFERTVVSDP